MVLQKLFEQLHGLLPSHFWPEVAVVAKQLVEPVHSSRGSEAGGIVTEVLPVFSEGHSRPEQTSHLIPLKNAKRILKKLYSKTGKWFVQFCRWFIKKVLEFQALIYASNLYGLQGICLYLLLLIDSHGQIKFYWNQTNWNISNSLLIFLIFFLLKFTPLCI